MSFRGLQMTKTRLWIGYDPALVKRAVERRARLRRGGEGNFGGGGESADAQEEQGAGELDGMHDVRSEHSYNLIFFCVCKYDADLTLTGY